MILSSSSNENGSDTIEVFKYVHFVAMPCTTEHKCISTLSIVRCDQADPMSGYSVVAIDLLIRDSSYSSLLKCRY
jgi:hypothetical protein